MNKKKILIGIGVIIVAVVAVVLAITFIKNDKYTSDELKFKEEYESLNGTKREKDGKTIMDVTIPKENKMKYATSEEVINLLKNGTGVIYFGFPDCPWCRNAITSLISAAKCNCLEEIYYFNALSIRDTKHLDEDGNIVTDQKGTKEYYEIVKLLGDNLGTYEGLNDDSIKRLYFPTVVFVKDGKVVDIHISTVDSQEDPYKTLTKDEKKELQEAYEKGMDKIHQESNTCDIKSTTAC